MKVVVGHSEEEGRERERGRHKKSENRKQPMWWIMTAVKWITQEGEALQNIDLMLHSCREDVHPHYARSNIPQHTLGLWFPELLGEKEARTFLSDGHLSTIQCLQIKAWTESIKIQRKEPPMVERQWLALILWKIGCNWANKMALRSIPMNCFAQYCVKCHIKGHLFN